MQLSNDGSLREAWTKKRSLLILPSDLCKNLTLNQSAAIKTWNRLAIEALFIVEMLCYHTICYSTSTHSRSLFQLWLLVDDKPTLPEMVIDLYYPRWANRTTHLCAVKFSMRKGVANMRSWRSSERTIKWLFEDNLQSWRLFVKWDVNFLEEEVLTRMLETSAWMNMIFHNTNLILIGYHW